MSLGSQSNFLFGAASAAAGGGGFQIERSVRFNSGDSARLTRQPSSAGNRTTWTYSFWVKRSINALFYQSFLINRVNASYNLRIDDPTTPKFYLAFALGVNLTTTPVYRDPEAWMHVVIVYNSATTTSTDRLQLYVNGSRVTDFDSINYPTFNQFSEFNKTDEHGIGYFNANTGLDGYLTNVEFIDGRAVAPTDFGVLDANGVWQPKQYTGTFASTVTQTPSLDGAMIIKADGAQMTGYVSGSGLKCLYTSSNGINWTFQNREAVGPFQSDAKYLAIGASGTNDITFFPGNGESFTYAMYSATTDFTTQSDINVDTTSLSYSASGTTSYGANGFHLDFSDNSSASALGTDSSGNGNDWTVTNISAASGSISDATGALPLYNTTDNYGRVKGTGFRTDSNASHLQIAVAGDSSDEVAYAIRGSGSALALTNISVTFNQTGKFYSDAYLIQNAGAVCQVAEFNGAKPGTSDFCVEFWINPTTTPANSGLFSYGNYNTVGSFGIMTTGSNSLRVDMHDGVTSGSQLTVANGLQANEWQHFALTRTGTNCVLYRNGVSQGSWTIDASADFTPASNPRYAIGNRLGLPFSSYNITSYFQDFRVYVGTAKYSGDFSIVNPDIASDNDSLLDSPTNGTQTDTGIGGEVSGNYCTINAIHSTATLLNGNLDVQVAASGHSNNYGTVGMSSGKWYWEVYRDTFNANTGTIGFHGSASANKKIGATWPAPASNADQHVFYFNATTSGILYNGQSGASFSFSGTSTPTLPTNWNTAGGYWMFCVDMDNHKAWIGKDGVWWGWTGSAYTTTGGDPANGLNPTFALNANDTYFPFNGAYDTAAGQYTYKHNFGQRPFAYTAPSGFKALCTANLDDPTILDGSTQMDAVAYAGNGSTQSITGLGFSPDLVWCKRRSGVANHHLYDIVRGATERLQSSTTNVESTAVGGVTSFDSDGWTMGNDADINGSSNTFVGWAWDGGSEARYSPGLSGTDLRSAYLAFESGSNLNDYDRVARLPGVGTITWTAGNNIEPIGNVTNLDLYIYQNDSIDTVSFTINGSSATPSSTIRTPSNPYGIYGYRFAVSATVSSFSFTNSSASARLKRVSADGVDLTESINTNGSIPAAVNANASAGFSIVSYTGTGSNATVGHGLNAAPEFMFLKNRDGTQNWQVYHSSIGPTKYLNITTAAAFTNSNRWQDTAPTSSVFSIGTAPGLNTSTARIIAYCFAPVEGYSSFGSYVGNGSADGPFVYTGFSPRWIMTKPSSAVGDWMLWDTARHPSNTNDATLSPNTNAADTDGAGYDVDILSNGFKLREFGSSSNASGVTYLYACFSENPFKNARAR